MSGAPAGANMRRRGAPPVDNRAQEAKLRLQQKLLERGGTPSANAANSAPSPRPNQSQPNQPRGGNQKQQQPQQQQMQRRPGPGAITFKTKEEADRFSKGMQHVVKAWRMFLIPRKELRMKYAQLQMEKWKKESEEKVRKFLMKCVRRNRKLWEENEDLERQRRALISLRRAFLSYLIPRKKIRDKITKDSSKEQNERRAIPIIQRFLRVCLEKGKKRLDKMGDKEKDRRGSLICFRMHQQYLRNHKVERAKLKAQRSPEKHYMYCVETIQKGWRAGLTKTRKKNKATGKFCMKFIIGLLLILSLVGALIYFGSDYEMEQKGFKDYYGALGISKSASDAEIRKVHRRLAIQWHPDRNPDCAECPRKYAEIAEAYEVLIHPDTRAYFDATHTAPTPAMLLKAKSKGTG